MMTTFIVKCADVEWQRHSVSIVVGNYRTKLQRLSGRWDPLLMTGERVRPWDLTAVAGTDYSMDTIGVSIVLAQSSSRSEATRSVCVWR